jgi:hypothetical protein
VIHSDGVVPARQIRAIYDDRSVTVFQAFRAEIAEAALRAGTFVAPFGMGRMTWIKPSFLWMMYRSGWATKPGQEHILAVQLTRDGFENILGQACLSAFDPAFHSSQEAWNQQRRSTRVRVQWDPERSLTLEPLPWRSVQVGLSGPVVRRYVADWIVGISDATPVAVAVAAAVHAGDLGTARARLPMERPYPLPAGIAAVIGATPASR